MQILSDQTKAKILFGNILLLQIKPMLEKAAPIMQCACFVTKASVDTAPPEQQNISWTSCLGPRKEWNMSMYCYLQKRQ